MEWVKCSWLLRCREIARRIKKFGGIENLENMWGTIVVITVN